MGEISKKVNQKKLFQVSEIEQDIAIKAAKNDHTKEVEDIIEDLDVDNFEKVRLVIIYAIRYEGDSNVKKFKDMLKKNGVKESHISFIDYVLEYAGKKKRSPFLFGKSGDILSAALNIFKSNFKDVKNVFTQHRSCMHSIIEQQMKGKLSLTDFPYTNRAPEEKKSNDIIVFIIGGATFQEAKEVAEFNNLSELNNIILGGTYIHNMPSFIAEATEVQNFD